MRYFNLTVLILFSVLIVSCMKFTAEDKHKVDVQRQLNSSSKNFYELDKEMDNVRDSGDVPDQ